jgi:SAM-dependent methyltransferase
MDAADNQRTSKDNRNLYPKAFLCTTWDAWQKDVAEQKPTDWILIGDTLSDAERLEHYAKDVILNPGCFYFYRSMAAVNVMARSLRESIRNPQKMDCNLWSYYPLDKIVSMELSKLEREKELQNQFADIPKGSRLAVYGAGVQGRKVMTYLLQQSDFKVCGWVDKKYQEIGWPVSDPSSLKSLEYDYLIVAVMSKALCDVILAELNEQGIKPEQVIWNGEMVNAISLKRWECCPICHSKDFKTVDYIGTCQDCGHMFRVVTPKETLSHYYKKSYWESDKNRQGIYSVQPGDAYSSWLKGRLEILESFGLLNHSDSGKVRILEFGCAEGMLLYALKQKGYQVMGEDVCAITDESSQALDVPISNLPIEEFCLQEGLEPFDLIMSFHVVEHLHDPRAVMEKLVSLLKPNGQMLLHVPMDDMELSNMDHFHFFSHESCMRLMGLFTKDIHYDFSRYAIHPEESMDVTAVAATYVGRKKNE